MGGVLCPFLGELNRHLTHCHLGRGLPPHQVAFSSIQPFGHNRHGPKIGGCAPLGGAGYPCNTMSPGPTSTSLSSGILIHPAVWPQQTPAENGGVRVVFPFLRGAGSSCNTMWPGPGPTPVPSGTLIHAAVWPQHVGQNWGAVPLFGSERVPI